MATLCLSGFRASSIWLSSSAAAPDRCASRFARYLHHYRASSSRPCLPRPSHHLTTPARCSHSSNGILDSLARPPLECRRQSSRAFSATTVTQNAKSPSRPKSKPSRASTSPKASPRKPASPSAPRPSPSSAAPSTAASSDDQTTPPAKNENSAEEADVEEQEYTDSTGVPLDLDPETHPDGELSQDEVREIFGKTLEPFDANHVLRVLQYRRMEGSLLDVGTEVRYVPKLTAEHVEAALAYLRREFPLDEEAAYQRWAEDEAAKLEWEIAERRRMREAGEKPWEYEVQDLKEVRSRQSNPYGNASYVDRMIKRAERRKKDREEEERKEAERRLLEQQQQQGEIRQIEGESHHSGPVVPAWRQTELAAREQPEWVKYYRQRGQISDSETAPEMSAFQRIWPSFLFLTATFLACFYLASTYEPPSTAARLFSNTPPAAATCGALIGINFLIFVLWKFPPLYRFFNRYFYLTPGLPNAFSLLGSTFSHQSFTHLAMNMGAVWFIGTAVHDEIGRGQFLALYVACGVGSSFATLLINTLTRTFITATMGASGVAFGLVAANCFLTPETMVKLPYVDAEVPLQKKFMLAILTFFELVQLFRGGVFVTMIDHYAHLGGMLMGVLGVKYLETLETKSSSQNVEANVADPALGESPAAEMADDTPARESGPGAMLEKTSGWLNVANDEKKETEKKDG